MNMNEIDKVYYQLETAAHRAYNRGIQTGSGGNLSAKIPGTQNMIVKSSGGSFADCKQNGEGFVVTDFFGNLIEATGAKPTRESFLHGLLYQINPEIGGVVHTHSPWSIAWSFTQKELPMITQHLKLKFGMPIPVVSVNSPMVRPEDRELIEPLFLENKKLPAFILVGHGIVAVGKDVLEAEHNAELVEETAQIAILNTIMLKLSILE